VIDCQDISNYYDDTVCKSIWCKNMRVKKNKGARLSENAARILEVSGPGAGP
jgi:hypothetical protein